MKGIRVLIFLFTCSLSCGKAGTVMGMSDDTTATYRYLALGDSYTIGEMVPEQDNFPHQVYAMLKRDGIALMPPRIIARTGWTTDELEKGIRAADLADPLVPDFDLVTLLIGVNNQYRGRPVSDYRPEFEELLDKAVRFAGNRPGRVLVLSIPDWGVTPFASGRDRAQIASEIDAYNQANEEIARKKGVAYLNITPWTREAVADPGLLASDGLHPSAKEYRRWAERVRDFFRSKI